MQQISNAVTDGESRAEPGRCEARPEKNLEQRIAQLVTKAEFAQLAIRADLGVLLARLELWEQRLVLSEQRLVTEIARHTQAVQNTGSRQVSASRPRTRGSR